jgi:heme/copper-type cytochrome/quinol oxidase subunit 3
VGAIQKGNMKSFQRSIATVLFFGALFVGAQVYEFWHFAVDKDLTITNSLFGSTFYVLTGTHGIHVTIGLIWLATFYVLGAMGKLTTADAIDVETAGLYWHFVDIVWIVIFTAVYLVEYIL